MIFLLKQFSFKEYIVFCLYALILVGLFFYSFTQIDLSLAISRNEDLQSIVKSFQYIGYFDRPLSTTLYIVLLVLLFGFYIAFLQFANKNRVKKKFVFLLIGAATVILTFSYNAFSYDIFNYIFDAKIVTQYHQNPYDHKALDYPGDPMLSFMRWTHRDYPYGPAWLALTVPLSFIGFGKFIPTFILFKLLMAGSYLGCLYFISKILQKLKPDKEIFGLVFFGLSPFVLIESLVSAHIDIVMMFFAIWAFYLLILQKYIIAYLLLIVSIGIKFVTGFILPVFMITTVWQQKPVNLHWPTVYILFIVTISLGIIAETVVGGTFQPWYLLVLMPFAALWGYKYVIAIPVTIITFFAMLTYVPFLFVGNWDPPIPKNLSEMYFFSYSFAFFVLSMYFGYKQILFAKTHKKNLHKK